MDKMYVFCEFVYLDSLCARDCILRGFYQTELTRTFLGASSEKQHLKHSSMPMGDRKRKVKCHVLGYNCSKLITFFVDADKYTFAL